MIRFQQLTDRNVQSADFLAASTFLAARPPDVIDFSCGFEFADGLVRSPRSSSVDGRPAGLEADVISTSLVENWLPRGRLLRLRLRRRRMQTAVMV